MLNGRDILQAYVVAGAEGWLVESIIVTVTVTGAGQVGQAVHTGEDAAEDVAAFETGVTRVNEPAVLMQLCPLGYE